MYKKLFFTWEYTLPRLLIHNINLAGHRKCMLSTALGFPGDRVIAPFWHCRSEVFPKGRCPHYLKVFCETGHNSVLLNITENMK